MPSTPNGIPYPAGSDTPDVPYWNQQLAEAVDPYIGDTGWQEIPLAAGIVAGSRAPSYRRRGGVVYLQGYFEAANIPAATDTDVGTLPAFMRPDSNLAFACASSTSDNAGHRLRIYSNGTLLLNPPTTAGWYAIDGVTFLVA